MNEKKTSAIELAANITGKAVSVESGMEAQQLVKVLIGLKRSLDKESAEHAECEKALVDCKAYRNKCAKAAQGKTTSLWFAAVYKDGVATRVHGVAGYSKLK